jgi:hypothetical protein
MSPETKAMIERAERALCDAEQLQRESVELKGRSRATREVAKRNRDDLDSAETAEE